MENFPGERERKKDYRCKVNGLTSDIRSIVSLKSQMCFDKAVAGAISVLVKIFQFGKCYFETLHI